MKGADLGFSAKAQGKEIIIFHHGKKATTLRGRAAIDFREDLDQLSHSEQQQLMARVTGNYKHGNERTAKHHPRNKR